MLWNVSGNIYCDEHNRMNDCAHVAPALEQAEEEYTEFARHERRGVTPCSVHGTTQCDCVTEVVRRGVDNMTFLIGIALFFFLGMALIMGALQAESYNIVGRVLMGIMGVGVWVALFIGMFFD